MGKIKRKTRRKKHAKRKHSRRRVSRSAKQTKRCKTKRTKRYLKNARYRKRQNVGGGPYSDSGSSSSTGEKEKYDSFRKSFEDKYKNYTYRITDEDNGQYFRRTNWISTING